MNSSKTNRSFLNIRIIKNIYFLRRGSNLNLFLSIILSKFDGKRCDFSSFQLLGSSLSFTFTYLTIPIFKIILCKFLLINNFVWLRKLWSKIKYILICYQIQKFKSKLDIVSISKNLQIFECLILFPYPFNEPTFIVSLLFVTKLIFIFLNLFIK